ncbi:TM2 domain containing protein [Pseudopedobacter saltans DSM 12145]|uniref:TM2 domain containing protein n=1 Tax=Pseudopedobacter saltans (strain ATCC 51119 / DSM 12145 / JCM 21818 / CCUG 39354 / LMG 10337 / NBRC 100064 / NCIMB 13643) TaxID=762903 RepID=F0SC08_PSESL|nr:TM2 domain-containing protein [Pseudopedobacter saltans]ADY53849.1 TM2 domain containing protein [Pseudopedobacter saltans DSM 12145]
MINDNFFYLANVTDQELVFLREITKDMTEEQRKGFSVVYNGKRRDPQHILLFTLLGFFGASGIQRFLTNQIGLGILYFLTVGLCFIGTIVDLINYKSIANEYNYKMALESARFISL